MNHLESLQFLHNELVKVNKFNALKQPREYHKLLNIYNPGFVGRVGAAFTPLDLANLHNWYDCSVLSSITKDGSNRVSQINDLSGNGYHLKQATAGNQPLWVDGGRNIEDVVDFAGARFMEMDAIAAISFPWNIFFVIKFPATAVGVRVQFSDIAQSAVYFAKNTTTNGFQMYNGTLQSFVKAGLENTYVYGHLFYDSGAVSDAEIKDVAELTNVDLGVKTSTGTQMMSDWDGTGDGEGILSEFFMVDGTSTSSEISDAIAYLKAKWGF